MNYFTLLGCSVIFFFSFFFSFFFLSLVFGQTAQQLCCSEFLSRIRETLTLTVTEIQEVHWVASFCHMAKVSQHKNEKVTSNFVLKNFYFAT